MGTLPVEAPKKTRKRSGSRAVPAPSAAAPAYGGFARRLAALVIDKLIFWALMAFVFRHSSFVWGNGNGAWVGGWTAMGSGMFEPTLENMANTLLAIAYETAMVAEFGATLGKMMFGLRVLHEGEKLSYARSLARVFAKFLSGIVLFLGYLMVLWDPEKRALHDYLCQTRVVKS